MFFFFKDHYYNFHSSRIINFIANIIDNYFILLKSFLEKFLYVSMYKYICESSVVHLIHTWWRG